MSLRELLGDRQNARLLRLSFPNGDAPEAELLVKRFEGSEWISRDFSFRVELLSDDAQIPLTSLQGKLACVSLVQADGALRPFTGHVSQFKLVRTDGGVAFYEAELVPWFAYARLRRNNRLFHEQSLQQQVQEIFQDYGTVAVWSWNVLGEQPTFTMAAQWDETDHNYICRRLEAAGCVYWYEHTDKGHTLKVADRTILAEPIKGAEIRFHRDGGSEEEDAIQRWSPLREWVPARAAVSGFDFKAPTPVHAELPTVHEQGDVLALEVHSYAGHYGFKHRSGADALAQLRMEEIESRGERFEAQGNNRCVAPGRCFKLTDHFAADPQREFLILEVRHEASNNYLQDEGEPSTYKNSLVCQRKDVPWRPGRGFNSTQTRILAPQTALVVGPAEQGSVHVDAYGRVKVQFHWDRDATQTCWVRVATNWAGGEKGLISHPRVGSEVIVQWLDGNPDHPLVMGAVHNQSYMPPWKLPAQKALTGIRSRELSGGGGNSAAGRSNHLLMDDTDGGIQVQLRSDHQASQLSLGHITRVEDNAGRKDARGQGFELRTDGHGALRAQQGLLISTEGRPNARAHMTDMGETVERLAQSQGLHASLSEAAMEARAHQAGDQDEVVQVLKAQTEAIKGQGGAPQEGDFPEFRQAHLVLASPAGIESTAQGSTHQASAEHHAITTGGHTSLSAGKSLLASVREAVKLFAHKLGMRLVAAGGDIDIQALKDSVNVLAKLNITHTANRITITAKEEVVINGGTSFSRWNAAGITHGTSGVWREHAAQHSLVVAASEGKPNLPETTVLPTGQLDLYHQYLGPDGAKVEAVKGGAYTVTDAEGGVHTGVLDGKGFGTLSGLAMGQAKVAYGPDPRDPWEMGSYFGKADAWPGQALPGAADAAQVMAVPSGRPASTVGNASAQGRGAGTDTAGTNTAGLGAGAMAGALGMAAMAKGALGQVSPVVNQAKQAVSTVQAVQQGGAKALLGPLTQVLPAGKTGPLGGQALAQTLPGAIPKAKHVSDLGGLAHLV